jgi:lipoprotein-anchoring transpeptidase ErfK/SrfK
MRIVDPKTLLALTLAAACLTWGGDAAIAAGDPPDKAAKAMAKQHPKADQIASAGFKAEGADRAFLVRVQVLLDRARFHPGVIDGIRGENLDNAVRAFKAARGLPEDATLDEFTWKALSEGDPAPPLTEYVVTKDDAKGPFTKTIPAKMELQSKLDSLGYRDGWEALAERFHMGVGFLRELNRGKDPSRPGTKLTVADVGERLDPTDPKQAGRDMRKAAKENPDRPRATRVLVDKKAHLVTAYGGDGKPLATYPASIGSTDKPAPSGTLKVERIAPNPGYTYNPKYAFKGVKAKEVFEIKPGPNNPVGVVWIALTGEGYGIHGTPEPDRVGKTNSHGCIRLTNWNAIELAALLDKDVPVEFKD